MYRFFGAVSLKCLYSRSNPAERMFQSTVDRRERERSFSPRVMKIAQTETKARRFGTARKICIAEAITKENMWGGPLWGLKKLQHYCGTLDVCGVVELETYYLI